MPTYKLTEEVGDSAIRDISNHSKEKECPCHRVQKGFFSLVHFEVLVTNALLVDTNTGDGKDAVFLFEPSCVKLTVWNNPKEDEPQCDG